MKEVLLPVRSSPTERSQFFLLTWTSTLDQNLERPADLQTTAFVYQSLQKDSSHAQSEPGLQTYQQQLWLRVQLKGRIPYQSPTKVFTCRTCGCSYYTQELLVENAKNHCRELENQYGACRGQLESTEALRNHLWSC